MCNVQGIEEFVRAIGKFKKLSIRVFESQLYITITYYSIGHVRTKWMAPNKFCGIFCVHWFGQVYYSITASNGNVIVFFQFEYAEFSDYVHFFRFRPQILFLGKFGPKNQNPQFILNLLPELI